MIEEIKSLTLVEIGRKIGAKNSECGYCDTVLNAEDVDCWGPHDAGIHVAGFKEKQWIFFKCSGCGHEWSLDKILSWPEFNPMKKLCEEETCNPEICKAVVGECEYFDDLRFTDYEAHPNSFVLYPEEIPFYEKWKKR